MGLVTKYYLRLIKYCQPHKLHNLSFVGSMIAEIVLFKIFSEAGTRNVISFKVGTFLMAALLSIKFQHYERSKDFLIFCIKLVI